MDRKLRMGMIGGGNGAFIGAIHRAAALMDNQIELVCGCFSSRPDVSLASGREYFLSDERIYASFREMIEREAALPEGVRMDFVSIVTPNFLHFEPAMAALDRGFDVVLDKPMTYSLDEAYRLREKIRETGRTLALTHTYSGYPAVKEARERVASGVFGKIRKIYVEYPQGWLSDRAELQPGSNAGWRTDPARAGKAGCMGDIGTHALQLAEYVSGQRCASLCADLSAIVEGRSLDDDGAALLRFDGGASGVLIATQVAAGEENDISIRLYGEKGGMEWHQAEPNSLYVKWPDRPMEVVRTGNGYMGAAARANTRTPGGHPEGYIEAFANIYRNFARTVRARREGREPQPEWTDFPSVEDGIRGMQFIETMVRSGSDPDRKFRSAGEYIVPKRPGAFLRTRPVFSA